MVAHAADLPQLAAAPGLLAEENIGPTPHFALTAGRGGELRQLGRMGHHGGWLEWF